MLCCDVSGWGPLRAWDKKGDISSSAGKAIWKNWKIENKICLYLLGSDIQGPITYSRKDTETCERFTIYLLKQGKLCIKTPGIKEQRYGRVYSQTHDGDTYQRLGSMPTIPCRKKIDFFGAWLPYKKRGAIKIPNLSHDLLSSMSMRWMFEPLQMKTSDEWQIFHSQLFSRFLKIREMC